MAVSGIDTKNQRVRLEIACNDPDNGLFDGRAQQIQIGHEFIELEARREPAPRFVELPREFRMSGKTFPHLGSVQWLGNWCWNAYWLDIGICVHFLDWLHRRNLFDLTCGDARIFERWRLREPFTHEDRDFLRDQLHKPSNFEF